MLLFSRSVQRSDDSMLTDKDKAKLLEILGQDIEDLPSIFEEIDGVVNLYLINRDFVNQNPKRAIRKSELEVLSKALTVILARKPTAELIFSGTEEYANLLASAAPLNEMLSLVLKEKSAHGKEPDDRAWLINRLAELFSEATGDRPTITWNDIEGTYSGRFYDFCWIAFPGSTDASIGKIIQKVLRLRKKEEKQ